MSRRLLAALLAGLAACLFASTLAEARGGHSGGRGGHAHGHGGARFHGRGHFHHHSRFIVAAPLFAGGYLAAPYAYAPAATHGPTFYVEQSDPYRYWCAPAAAYFPDVTQCPWDWERVPLESR